MPLNFDTFSQSLQKFSAKKMLLAFSGGIDSVVLAHLLKESKQLFALAHCNFKLRGNESDGDEEFAQKFANTLKVPFYSIAFETEKYARKNKLSTQVAARQLRYNWFYELMDSEGYSYLVTAHHQTDQVETMLLNIARGTGLAGLQGMKIEDGNLVRPLLLATRAEIEMYATAKKLKWREDSSNSLNKYNRNKLRNVVLPVLKGVNPQYEENFFHLSTLAGEYRQLVAETIAANTKNMVRWEGGVLRIEKEKLLGLPHVALYLYELLKPFGCNASTLSQIKQGLDKSSGAVFYGTNGKILIDRNELIALPHNLADNNSSLELTEDTTTFVFANKQYKTTIVSATNYTIDANPAIAQLDADKIKFPIAVRAWKKGDYFYPLGMKKKKKVSDFFINQKIPLFDKPCYPILFSGAHIICIAALRVDDRYKITPQTKKVWVLTPI